MSIEPLKTKSEKSDPLIRSLPIKEWPAADRIAWEAACRLGVRLKGGGAANHLRPVTQRMLAQRYGLFLDFAWRSKKLEQEAEAGGHVTPELVEPFVEELKERVSSVTVYSSIQKLRRMTQLIAPKREIGWLVEIERELFSAMRPKSKWDRVVLAEVTIEAGLTLIAGSRGSKETTQAHRSPHGPQWANDRIIGPLPYPAKKLRGSLYWPQHRQNRQSLVGHPYRRRDQGEKSG
jgi:hypothetical protein